MDGYPTGSLDHNLPFIVVAGLISKPANELPFGPELKEDAILLRSEFPNLDSDAAQTIGDYILSLDARDQPGNSPEDERPLKFRIELSGRSFALPPRRARIPADIDPPEQPPILHSPFSPLSPVSRLYPDGLIDASWLRKHQDLVPSVYVCFYSLTADPSLATLHDNQLKTDINGIKQALGQSGYRTRLTVVLLCDGLPEGIQERLQNIRRGVGLDSRSFFYIITQESPTDLQHSTANILSTVHAQSSEYYRDLGRHARKKRSRGIVPQPTVPPTTGTSQTLSISDWNVRYDFKSAIFAEFRREMDSALRSYDQAYEGILSQEVMDILPSWSPRWNEARLLTDVVAIRAMRCSLWNGQTTSAVKRWRAHRARIADIVDRRGRGTNNYGWEAWESRWALVMANLMEKTHLPGLDPATLALFIPPEKIVMGERLQPWEMLHHTGYWYRAAARHLGARRALARAMPEEDRRAPGASPASLVASRGFNYDTYMCPEPHEEFPLEGEGEGTNHSQMIIDCLMAARSEFQARKQFRLAAELSLECAREIVRLEAWEDVVALLKPLWVDMSFRAEGWWEIAEDLSWILRNAAFHLGMGDLIVSIDWELLNRQFSRRLNWHYDLSKSLNGVESKTKPRIRAGDDELSSFVSATFVFPSDEGKAGDTCQAQLTLTSNAFPDSNPVVLRGIQIDFEGSLKPIALDHEPTRDGSSSSVMKGNTTLFAIPLKEAAKGGKEDEESDGSEEKSILTGAADLELRPGQTRIYEMAIPLREPGKAQAVCVDLMVTSDTFDLTYTINFREANTAEAWFICPSLSTRRILRLNSHAIEVQPKPPKMEIRQPEQRDQHYTDEPVDLVLDIVNAEEADAVAKLEIDVLGEEIPPMRVVLEGQDDRTVEGAKDELKIEGLSLAKLGVSQSTQARLHISPSSRPAAYDISLRIAYYIVTDPATPIAQTMSFRVSIINPFEANYDFVPRLHPDPWPSLFEYDETAGAAEDRDDATVQPRGLVQKWCLKCRYASFASEDLQITGLDVQVLSCRPSARCMSISSPELPADGLTVSPKSMQKAEFELVVQKLSLDDRGPAALELALVLQWRRAAAASDSEPNTTTMLVPRSIILGTEPRVLASVGSVSAETGLMSLDVAIENASSHFLTFELTMEPSEEFSFSEPGQTTLHVLPVSRRTVQYKILPLVKEGGYVRPNLVVRDKYFQKVLRVIPTEGMKIDRDGLLIWVPGEDGRERNRESVELG